MTSPPRHWATALVPDYGDHLGRYTGVADALATAGATVLGYTIDPSFTDFESTVDGLRALIPDGVPTVLIGLGLGGTVVVRHAQRYPDATAALVLAGPVLGSWPGTDLLAEDPVPGPAVDPDLLS